MSLAAKEEMFSTLGDPCVFFPLAAFEGVGENSRLGSARRNAALHRGGAWSNSARALGIEEVLLESRVGCRSSGNSSSGLVIGGYDVKTFVHGVLYGVRQPGQGFAACVANNANQTTFGAVNAVSQKVGDAKVIAAQIVAGTAAMASQIRAAGPSVKAMSQVLGVALRGMTLAQRFGAGIALLGGGGSFRAARLGAAAAQGAGKLAGEGLLIGVVALAALAAGSAFNCR